MNRHLSVFARQLAAMLRGGLPLTTALGHLSRYPHRGYAHAAQNAAQGLLDGKPFSKLLAAHPKLFPDLCRQMVKVGEDNDTLVPALELLADHYKLMEEFRDRLIRALFYPLLLLGLATAGGMFALWQVVPTFARLYYVMDVAVPPATARVFALSRVLTPQVTANAVTVLLVLAFIVVQKGRTLPWIIASRLPLLGDLGCYYFCQVTVMTIRVGNNLERALALTAKTFPYGPANAAHQGLREGNPLHQALELGPELLSSFMAQGEAIGELPRALEQAADYYRARTAETLEGVQRYAEPLAVLAVGLLILMMLLVLMLPMLQLSAVL